MFSDHQFVNSYDPNRYGNLVDDPIHTSQNLHSSRSITPITFAENVDPDEFIRTYGIMKLKNIVKGKLHELRSRKSGC